MLFPNSRRPTYSCCLRFEANLQVAGFMVGSRCLKNTPVQRCEAYVKNFPALCLFGVHFGSVAELERTELFSDRAYAMFDVVTVELERLTIGSYSAQCDM